MASFSVSILIQIPQHWITKRLHQSSEAQSFHLFTVRFIALPMNSRLLPILSNTLFAERVYFSLNCSQSFGVLAVCPGTYILPGRWVLLGADSGTAHKYTFTRCAICWVVWIALEIGWNRHYDCDTHIVITTSCDCIHSAYINNIAFVGFQPTGQPQERL